MVLFIYWKWGYLNWMLNIYKKFKLIILHENYGTFPLEEALKLSALFW